MGNVIDSQTMSSNIELLQKFNNLENTIKKNKPRINTEYLDEKINNLLEKQLNTFTNDSTPTAGISASFAGQKYFNHKGYRPGKPGIYPNLDLDRPFTKDTLVNMASESRYWPNAAAMVLEHEGYINSQDNLSKHLDELKVGEGKRGYGVIRFYVATDLSAPDPKIDGNSTLIKTISKSMFFGGTDENGHNAGDLPFSGPNELYKLENINITNILKDYNFEATSQTANISKNIYFRIVPAHREPIIADAFTHQLAVYLPNLEQLGTINLPVGPENPSINGGDAYKAPNPFIFPEEWQDGDPFNDNIRKVYTEPSDKVPYFGIYAKVIISLLAKPINSAIQTRDKNDFNAALQIVKRLGFHKLLWQQPGTMWNYTGGAEISFLACQRTYNKVNETKYDAFTIMKKVLFEKIGMHDTYSVFPRSDFEEKKSRLYPGTGSNLPKSFYPFLLQLTGIDIDSIPNLIPWLQFNNEPIPLTITELFNDFTFEQFKSYIFIVDDEYLKENEGNEAAFGSGVVGWWSTDVDRLNYYTFLVNGNDINGNQLVSREILYKYTRSVNNGYSPEEWNNWGYYPLSFGGLPSSESTFVGRAFREGSGRVVSLSSSYDTPVQFNNFDPTALGLLPNGADLFWGGAAGTLFHIDYADNTVYLLNVAQGVPGGAVLLENTLEANIEQEGYLLVMFNYAKRYLQNSLIIPASHQIGSNTNLELSEFITSVSDTLYGLGKQIKKLEDNRPKIDTNYLDIKIGNLFDLKVNQEFTESSPYAGIGFSFAGEKYYNHRGFKPAGKFPVDSFTDIPYTENTIIGMASESRYWNSSLTMILENMDYLKAQDNLSEYLDEIKFDANNDRGDADSYFGVIRFYVSLESGSPEPANFIIKDIDEKLFYGGKDNNGKTASQLPFSLENELYRIKNFNEINDIYFRIVPAIREPTLADAMMHQIGCNTYNLGSIQRFKSIYGPEETELSIKGGPKYEEFGNYPNLILSLLAPEIKNVYNTRNRNDINLSLQLVKQLASTKLLHTQPGSYWNYTGSGSFAQISCVRRYNKINKTNYNAQQLLKKVLFEPLGIEDIHLYFTEKEFEEKKDRIFLPVYTNLNEFLAKRADFPEPYNPEKPGFTGFPKWADYLKIGKSNNYFDPSGASGLPNPSFTFRVAVLSEEEENNGIEAQQYDYVVGQWASEKSRLLLYTFLITGNDKNNKPLVTKDILYKYTRTVQNGYNSNEVDNFGNPTLPFGLPYSVESTLVGRAVRDDAGRVLNINNLDELHLESNFIVEEDPLPFPLYGDVQWAGALITVFYINFNNNSAMTYSLNLLNNGRYAQHVGNLLDENISQESMISTTLRYANKYTQNAVIIPDSKLIGSNMPNKLSEFETSVADTINNLLKRIKILEDKQ